MASPAAAAALRHRTAAAAACPRSSSLAGMPPCRPADTVSIAKAAATRRQRGAVHLHAAIGQRRSSARTRAAAADDVQVLVKEAATEAVSAVEDTATMVEESVADALAPTFSSWDGLTQKMVASSTFGFLLMLLPQIVKNAQSLVASTPEALAILPWVGYSTGLAGNLLLLSYFLTKGELSATTVQGIGALSTYVLVAQIFLAGYMPPLAFGGVTAALIVALLINSLYYAKVLPDPVWSVWRDVSGVAGLTILPQVVWSTVSSYPTPLPAVIAGSVGLSFVVFRRGGKLSQQLLAVWDGTSAWMATLLFMFMPIPQLISCFTSPASLAGISVLTPVLGMVSNGLLIPRALFTRDVMWFTGSTWGALMMGWGILLSMYAGQVIGQEVFFPISAALLAFLTLVLVRDSKANSLSHPLQPLQQLFSKD
eukprot:SM000088S23683  [mRNA]  locus=s88:62704:65564:- [translate_table: standard]